MADDLPFETGSFDACICKGALDHFDRPEEAIAEMARVTATDGRVVIAVANFESLACRVGRALDDLRQAAREGLNIMPASVAAAKAGVTTGEWGDVVRSVFGQYRAPTGVSTAPSNRTEGLDDLRSEVDAVSAKLGERLKFLVGKPGLDGHSNGAEQIAARARDAGMDITYEGIRLTPTEIVAAAQENRSHVIGLSILSGSHMPLIEELLSELRSAGLGHIPVVVGGIIPDEDAAKLLAMGVARVYTPKDFELNRIMFDIVALADPTPVAAE